MLPRPLVFSYCFSTVGGSIDPQLAEIAKYVTLNQNIRSLPPKIKKTALYTLKDAIGCASSTFTINSAKDMLGPIVPGTQSGPCRIIGTNFRVDPVTAAMNNGLLIRWLDYNDTWLAAEWGHPSDNYGAILSMAEYVSHLNVSNGKDPLTMKDVLIAGTAAYEIQGRLANQNSLNRRGIDHVVNVRIASAAASSFLLSSQTNPPDKVYQDVLNSTSQAFVDGSPLRCYRHTPNTGPRKSWAAGDATGRGVWLALMTDRGQPGYASPLSVPTWGFNDVFMGGQENGIKIGESEGFPLDSYIMENVLFKVKFPAEFHSQTACEAALTLNSQYSNGQSIGNAEWTKNISKIIMETHEPAIRIISKPPTQNQFVTPDPLNNPADRDHCLQYIAAISLLNGSLTTEMYENSYAEKYPIIDDIRSKMVVSENPSFTRDYYDPTKRSIANSMKLEFADGSQSETITVEYPVGHRERREEAYPLLDHKFSTNIRHHFDNERSVEIESMFDNLEEFEKLSVVDFMNKLSF